MESVEGSGMEVLFWEGWIKGLRGGDGRGSLGERKGKEGGRVKWRWGGGGGGLNS